MIIQPTQLFLRKNTITREYLARAIKRHTGLNINKASVIIDQIIASLTKHICDNKNVKIRLFGSFSTKHKNARVGRNPKNMQEVEILERTIPRFKIAPTLKKRINDNIDSIV